MDGSRPKGNEVRGIEESQVPQHFAKAPGPSKARREIERLTRISELHMAADNSVAALECLDRAAALAADIPNSPALVADLKARTSDCLRKRGDLGAALDQISDALTNLPVEGEPLLRGRILSREGAIRAGLGDYKSAREVCEQAYELLRASDEHVEIGMLELTLGTIHVRCGRMRDSQECFESALFTFRRIDHREGIARALNNLGLLLKNGPRWADARDYLKRALSVSEDAGNYARVASHCGNLGILYTKLCDWDQAEGHLTRGISIHKEVGNTFALAKALLARGHLHRRRGQREMAAARYAEARKLCQDHAYGREMVLCWEADGDLLIDGNRLDEAIESLERGLALAIHVAPDGDLVPELNRRLAAIALNKGDYRRARRLAARAIRGARRVNDIAEAGAALRVLGEALSRSGLGAPAKRALRRAVEVLGQTPERYEFALAQAALARHLAGSTEQSQASPPREKRHEAIELLQHAWGFFTSVELSERAAEVLTDLARVRVAFGDLDGALRDIARGHALAEQAGRGDLLDRLERIRESLEARSAEAALLTSPEVEIIRDWTRLSTEGGATHGWLQSMLNFVTDRLESDAGFLATPTEAGELEIIAGIGEGGRQGAGIAAVVAGHLNGGGVILGTDLAHDPRFAAHARGILADIRSFAVLALNLPEGRGLLYLDRRAADREPYGRADLRVLSILSGLLSLGLVQVRREQALELERSAAIQTNRKGPFTAYITADPNLLQTFGQLERVGGANASILTLGETGTGKGLLAECIHRASAHRLGPFVSINCAAIPESLLESELFGHVQGCFTGAYRDKRGLFEEATGGTLFLDEISRASLGVQAKLLHVLDTHEIRAVGATRGREVDVRIVCASNVDMQEAIRRGEFLEDLFYRLSDFTVQLPPLRERKGDIPLLLEHFFEKACAEMDRRPRGLVKEVKSLLLDHEWRGNIRELIQVVRRLVALAEDGELISADLLPREVRVAAQIEVGTVPGQPLPRAATGANGDGLRGHVLALEHQLISSALEAHGWNRSKVARELSISYPSLLAKIKLFGLKPPTRA